MTTRNRPSTVLERLVCGATLAAAVVACAGPAPARAQQDTAATLRSGLVINPALGLAYVMTPEGGIAGIELANGNTRWTSQAAAKPLGVVGNRLIAQVEPTAAANRLEVVALNAQSGGQPVARGISELPPGVRVSIGETLMGTFSAEARTVGGIVVIDWTFVPGSRRGMQDPADTAIAARPGQREAARGPIRGALRLNVSSGALTRLDTAQVSPPPRPRWVLPQGQKISSAAPTQYESVDGRHILASEAAADDRTFEKYRWTIYERGTGRRMGELRTHISFSPFIVRDSLVIFETTPYARGESEEPAKLRGFSLATGREVWSVEVREVVYRGPFPP
jgi:hypothetical protein